MLSPNEQVRVWLAQANPSDVLKLVNHMMTSDVRAAVLAYQWVCANPVCEHPGVFARPGHEAEHCFRCGRDIPATQL
jgi:hypothetical protein